MNEHEIETLLRKAPQPPPPPGLLARLKADAKATAAAGPVGFDARTWLRRLFPALAFGSVMLACLVALGVQTLQLAELRRGNETLRSATTGLEQARRDHDELDRLSGLSEELGRLRRDNADLERLRGEVTRLRAALADLPELRAEHQRLAGVHASLTTQTAAAEEESPFDEARKEAESTKCINHLKQIGLAARLWANDEDKGVLPFHFQSMQAEMGSPTILICPSTGSMVSPKTWAEFDFASVTYQMVSPGASELEPEVVYAHCPTHGHVALVDGSVQKKFGDRKIITRTDGKKVWGREQN